MSEDQQRVPASPAEVSPTTAAGPMTSKVMATTRRAASSVLAQLAQLGERLALLRPRTLGIGAAAGILAIVLLVALSGGLSLALVEEQPVTGAFALILFHAGARADRIATILAVNGAAIVEGPRPGGIYRIRIGAPDMTAEARSDALAKLAADKATVNFVVASP